MNIIILGKPGAGKGTQSSILASEFGFYHLSTGDLFRYHLKKETELGKKISSYMNSPNLVPDDIVNDVVLNEIETRNYDNIIFDGYPRTIPQALFLEDKLRKNIEYIFLLNVSDSTAMERVKRRQGLENRAESDGLEKINGRFVEYQRLTEHVVSMYKRQGMLTGLDGEEDIETVAEKIKKTISFIEKVVE